jgi:surface antigen
VKFAGGSLLLASAVALLALSGCKTAGLGVSQPIAYAPSADGTVGLIGGQIGRGIDDNDRKTGLGAEYRALEYGESGVGVDWTGRNGVAGAVVPGPRYRINDIDCRQYTHTIVFHSMTESAQATACRRSDGTWRLVA